MASTAGPTATGHPLQLVRLNMESNTAEVDDEAMKEFGSILQKVGSHKLAVVAVMGAFRTGKSFLLDLFLRYLRHEESNPGHNGHESEPRESGKDFAAPPWLTASEFVEGANDKAPSGFRFRGGMDACTEGIWVWSEPFPKMINGEKVMLILMDTQGAWDSELTQEQSATIFGLTAVLSSKLIYNINMQIQEDKIENLAYFMNFAQAALRAAASDGDVKMDQADLQKEIDQPFQSLDFLVRDWKNFRDNDSEDACNDMMEQHLKKHVNPEKRDTAKALDAMFRKMRCCCLPHPGLKIEKEAWTGAVSDIDQDFTRFMHRYVESVFRTDLDSKKILGTEISTITFPLVVKQFVQAFQGASCAAVGFTEAMRLSTTLLAKESAMKEYTKNLDEAVGKHPAGCEEKEFMTIHLEVYKHVKEQFEKSTIFGNDEAVADCWAGIEKALISLKDRYLEDNARKLEKALAKHANIALLATVLFILDRISDWTTDWWCETTCHLSRFALLIYTVVIIYIAVDVYFLNKTRGRTAVLMATGELWKEMMRLVGVYSVVVENAKLKDLPRALTRTLSGNKDPGPPEGTFGPESKKTQ